MSSFSRSSDKFWAEVEIDGPTSLHFYPSKLALGSKSGFQTYSETQQPNSICVTELAIGERLKKSGRVC